MASMLLTRSESGNTGIALTEDGRSSKRISMVVLTELHVDTVHGTCMGWIGLVRVWGYFDSVKTRPWPLHLSQLMSWNDHGATAHRSASSSIKCLVYYM